MYTIDDSFSRFLLIENEICDAQVITEQDTRLQIINRVLVDVLGWDYCDISTEPHTHSGFTDYLLKINNRPVFVVEAKRESVLLIDTVDTKYHVYQISGAAIKSAIDAIKQAKRYCADHSVAYAVVTTGKEWIGFQAIRTDGVNSLDGKAFVFPSIKAIHDNFADFYDLFSKYGIENLHHQARFMELDGFKISSSEVFGTVFDKNRISLIKKSNFAIDMEQIFRGFFSSLSDEKNREMLLECFVETKESRETEINMQKIASSLISNIDMLNSDNGNELENTIKAAVDYHTGDFAIIVGNKGAGKSTFIERFFEIILDKETRKKCLVLKIDVSKSSGDKASIVPWLRDELKVSIEKQLFTNGFPSYDELQGIFYDIYQSWKVGEYKHLYDNDKVGFKNKFGEYIHLLKEQRTDKYVNGLLNNCVKSRNLMPCIVFDNTDHFTQDFQEAVFQYAQSIYSSVYSFIICPITDRSVWQLSKEGPLQTYPTKAFYLPIPPAKEILDKRIKFIHKKLVEDNGKGQYFLDRGIRIEISRIKEFAACIEEILVGTEFSSRIIGSLTNFDIRRSLELSRHIVTSPSIHLEDIIKSFFSGDQLRVNLTDVKNALFHGQYNMYNAEANDFVRNVFNVEQSFVSSPLLIVSVLKLLYGAHSEKNVEDNFIEVRKITQYFEYAGIFKPILYHYLQMMVDFRLIVPYDPAIDKISDDLLVRISHSGRLHYEFTLTDPLYLQNMLMITPIRDIGVVQKIKEILSHALADWDLIRRTFVDYLISEDARYFTCPNSNAYNTQKQIRKDMISRWTLPHTVVSRKVTPSEEEAQP